MSDHSKALVSLESWCYHSPEIRFSGGLIDIGLMAEALIYYDQIFINVSNQPQFAEFLYWFIKQDKFSDLISLFDEQTIQVYDYAFISTAALKDDQYILVNIQDPIQEQPNTFEQRFLYHKSIEKYLKHSRHRDKLYRVLRDKVIEVKASDFGNTIENAHEDFKNPKRSSLVIQTLLDEIYPMLGWKEPMNVKSNIITSSNKTHITCNVDFDYISNALGKNLNFHKGTPLVGAVMCNRFLWSAAKLNCDLYLGKPISFLIGDKLFESTSRIVKNKDIIEQLQTEVEYPNIRELVNKGKLNLDDILTIRKKSKKFRSWLQAEGERDRNAIIAYHNEVAKESGLSKLGRKSLSLFGLLGGSALGAYIGFKTAKINGAVLGATAGQGVKYLLDLAAKFNTGWKPVVFGNWLKNKIEKLLEED